MNVFQNVSQIKVLIVDDDVLICETLFDLLTDLGFRQIKMVHSRKRVLEMLSLWEPDLIL